MSWQEQYRDKLVPADEAVKVVQSGDVVVFALGAGGEAHSLGFALAKRKDELREVTVFHAFASAPYPWFAPGMEESFRLRCSYVGIFDRHAIRERRSDYVPWSYGTGARQEEFDRWGAYTRPDVFMVKVSPPDRHGFCSFGNSVWYSPTCVRNARTVIAEVDASLIRTYGGNLVHVSELDYLVEAPPPRPLAFQFPPPPEDEARAAEVIGAQVAELIGDGDCIQVGVGLASQAVLSFLEARHDLGVHSELILVEMVELQQAGVITGKRKTLHPGKVVGTCFVIWPTTERHQRALEYINENPLFELYDIHYICSVPCLAAIDKFVAINSALAVDLSGQLCIDTLGSVPFSGTGGGLDFAVGANFSRGGRCIHTVMSTAQGGKVSRIVPQLEAGAVPTIPRNYVDYVVSEYGVASLQGKSLRQRAEALIAIAHPDFQSELRAAAQQLLWP